MNTQINLVKTIICSVLISTVLSSFGHAGKSLVYSVKLKKDVVILEITEHEEYATARYFYTSNLQETYLSGSVDTTNGYVLINNTDSLIISKNKSEPLLIWFRNGKKHRSKFELISIESTHYFKTRRSFLQFSTIETTDSILVVKEDVSGVIFFRSRLPDQDSLNQQLLQLHESYAFYSLKKSSDAEASVFNFEITHFSKPYISFLIQIDQELSYYNLNVESGNKIYLEDLVYFGVDRPPLYQSEKWFSYRYSQFPKHIIPLLKIGDTCLEKKEYWNFPTWYLEAHHLVLKPYALDKPENCNLDVLRKIPLSSFKRR